MSESPKTKQTGNRTSTINLDQLDKSFVDELIKKGADNLLTCYQCGTCSGGCPLGRHTAFRTRTLVRRALLGIKHEVLADKDLWLCTTCYTCFDRCPRDVQPTDVIKTLRNIAVKEGYMVEAHRERAELGLREGHLVPINDEFKESRKRLGLEEVPPNASRFEEAREEMRKIAKITGFDKLIKKPTIEEGQEQ